MNIFKTVKQIIYSTCLYFTAAEFIILIAADVIRQADAQVGGEVSSFLSLGSAGLILLACFLLSALNLIWKLDYSTAVKLLLHFIGALAVFAVIFVIIPGVYTDMAQLIVRVLFFAVIYFIVAFIALIVGSIRKNRRTEELDYESQFKNIK